jgi:acyl-CoA thioesterase-2
VEEPELDPAAIVDETIEYLRVRPAGDGAVDRFVGEAPTWFGEVLFGGFVVGQAISAALRTAPDGRRMHSLHSYFLRPVLAGAPLSYTVTPIRDGRTFTSRRIDVAQNGAPVYAMTCSFTADTGGGEYEMPLPQPVPDPETLELQPGPGPWLQAWIGPTEPDANGVRQSTHRHWFRVPAALPDDDAVHLALLGFATDWTGTGGRPLRLEGDVDGMVSLDHAVWFHRRARADEWLLYDVHSVVNAGGRGLLRGTMYDRDRRVVASVAQEMLLRDQ